MGMTSTETTGDQNDSAIGMVTNHDAKSASSTQPSTDHDIIATETVTNHDAKSASRTAISFVSSDHGDDPTFASLAVDTDIKVSTNAGYDQRVVDIQKTIEEFDYQVCAVGSSFNEIENKFHIGFVSLYK